MRRGEYAFSGSCYRTASFVYLATRGPGPAASPVHTSSLEANTSLLEWNSLRGRAHQSLVAMCIDTMLPALGTIATDLGADNEDRQLILSVFSRV